MTVGTKELKNRLSHYLRRVGDGEVVRVTDRGKVIAELRAVAGPAVDDERLLAELETDGVVTRGHGRFAAFRGVRLGGKIGASAAILADRR